MITLLDKAKASPIKVRRSKRNITAQEIDLAIAYIKSEVSQTQALSALNVTQGEIKNWVVTTLRLGMEKNLLVIRRKA